MSTNMEFFVQAKNGTFTINDTNSHDGNWIAIQVDATTVFTKICINGSASDIRNMKLASIGGNVADTLITPDEGDVFTTVQLASGQVTCINKPDQPL